MMQVLKKRGNRFDKRSLYLFVNLSCPVVWLLYFFHFMFSVIDIWHTHLHTHTHTTTHTHLHTHKYTLVTASARTYTNAHVLAWYLPFLSLPQFLCRRDPSLSFPVRLSALSLFTCLYNTQ